MKFIEGISSWLNKKQNLYILLAMGIIILISTNFLPEVNHENNESQIISAELSSKEEEERLATMLSKVSGAGKTEVMITYENSGERVPLQNSKVNKITKEGTNNSGITSEISEVKETVMNGGSSNRNPYIVQEITPRVRGVLVVTEGGGDKNVRYQITNAVAAVLDVPYHRIQVLKKSK